MCFLSQISFNSGYPLRNPIPRRTRKELTPLEYRQPAGHLPTPTTPKTRLPINEPGAVGRDWRRACMPKPERVAVEMTRQEMQSCWRVVDMVKRDVTLSQVTAKPAGITPN